MGMLAGGAALAAGAYGLSQGAPASNVQLPQMFQMPGMGAAAGGAMGGIGGLGNYNSYNLGEAKGITQGMVNSPYAGAYQQGAGTAGNLGQLQALGQYGVGQGVTGMGMNQLAPYAGQVMNTAFDPQQQLYNRMAQQTMDQSGAINAMTGVGTTPYGAGLQNQAMSNFNIDWQNQQLGRQTQGLGAAGQALGQAGSLAQLGQGMAAGAPGQYLQSAGLPYGVQQQIGGAQMGALGQLGQYGQQASQIPQMQIQDYLGYLGAGNQAGGVANQTANLGLQQSNLAFNQNAQYANSIYGGLGALGGRGYGMSGGSGWGGDNTYPGGNPMNAPFFQSGWNYQ
jgi:hypothetical protein